MHEDVKKRDLWNFLAIQNCTEEQESSALYQFGDKEP